MKARLNMTLGLLAVLALAAMWLTAAAQASPGVWWGISAGARPSLLPAGGEGGSWRPSRTWGTGQRMPLAEPS